MKRKKILRPIGYFLYILFFSPFLLLFLISEASGLIERIEPMKKQVREYKQNSMLTKLWKMNNIA